MSYREFNDRYGRLWEVWEVRPAVIERRQAEDRRLNPRDFADRRTPETPVRVMPGLGKGWLTFQSGSDRRRLSPIPDGWTTFSDEALLLLSAAAKPVARAGLPSKVSGFGYTPPFTEPVPADETIP